MAAHGNLMDASLAEVDVIIHLVFCALSALRKS